MVSVMSGVTLGPVEEDDRMEKKKGWRGLGGI